MNKREEILRKANECVNGQREMHYGSPEQNFETIAKFWSVYLAEKLDAEIDACDVAVMMSLLKIARIRNGNFKADSFIDLAGYAACAGEISANMGMHDVNILRFNGDDCCSCEV